MKICDIKDVLKAVNVKAQVIGKENAKEVKGKFDGGTYKVANLKIEDETGTVNLTLWNDDIDKVNVGDTVKVENGYTKTFKETLQLNVGRYGLLSVV